MKLRADKLEAIEIKEISEFNFIDFYYGRALAESFYEAADRLLLPDQTTAIHFIIATGT